MEAFASGHNPYRAQKELGFSYPTISSHFSKYERAARRSGVWDGCKLNSKRKLPFDQWHEVDQDVLLFLYRRFIRPKLHSVTNHAFDYVDGVEEGWTIDEALTPRDTEP